MEIPAAGNEAKLAWLSQLDRLRQPWPEWDRLIEVVRAGKFVLESPEDVPFETQFLVGPPDDRRKRMIKLWLPESEQPPLESLLSASTIYPPYLFALLDLKFTDHVMMAGGIAASLAFVSPPLGSGVLPMPILPNHTETIGNLFGHNDFSAVDWPSDPIYPLQTNSSGMMFCLNQSHKVIGFSVSQNRFLELGAVDVFVRYCINAVLDGKDWGSCYRQNIAADRYDLRFINDVGAD